MLLPLLAENSDWAGLFSVDAMLANNPKGGL